MNIFHKMFSRTLVQSTYINQFSIIHIHCHYTHLMISLPQTLLLLMIFSPRFLIMKLFEMILQKTFYSCISSLLCFFFTFIFDYLFGYIAAKHPVPCRITRSKVYPQWVITSNPIHTHTHTDTTTCIIRAYPLQIVYIYKCIYSIYEENCIVLVKYS